MYNAVFWLNQCSALLQICLFIMDIIRLSYNAGNVNTDTNAACLMTDCMMTANCFEI